MNPLPRKVLITTDEVIRLGFTEGVVDPRQLLSAIQIAEERFIKPAICADLYYDFRNQKNIVVTTENKTDLQNKINNGLKEPVTLEVGVMINAIEEVTDPWYKELWQEHLWKLTAECVIYVATPTNFMRFTAQGEMQNNPKSLTGGTEGQNSASADRKDVSWKMDRIMMDRIDPLIASMQQWLCENKKEFAKYTCRECSCSEDKSTGISYERKSGWIHGIYSDKKTCCDDA
ncbi:MAG: hypothetical protein ACTHMM_17685 [Agriterribacter sp.]